MTCQFCGKPDTTMGECDECERARERRNCHELIAGWKKLLATETDAECRRMMLDFIREEEEQLTALEAASV